MFAFASHILFVILEIVSRCLRNAKRSSDRFSLRIRSHARVYTCPTKIGLSVVTRAVDLSRLLIDDQPTGRPTSRPASAVSFIAY